MSAPCPPPPPPPMAMAPPPPPAMPAYNPSSSTRPANGNNNAPGRDNSQLLREIERGVTLRKTPQAPTNSFMQQPRQPPMSAMAQPGGVDEFEPVKQQLQAELNSTLRRRQNGAHNPIKPHFVVPKNSTINAIYNQLNELDNQKAAAAAAVDRKPSPPRESTPTYPSPTYSPPILTNASNNGAQFTSSATLPRATNSPSRSPEEPKPKLMINHGKPNFVRPSVPTMRPKPLDSIQIDRPESNDITRTLRGLKTVDPEEDIYTPPKPVETSPVLASKVRPVEVTPQTNNTNVIRNNVPNAPVTINHNILFNNTGASPRPAPATTRPTPAAATNAPATNGSPFVSRKFPASNAPAEAPTAQPATTNKDLTNVIRKLTAADLSDDMQLSDETYLTHVRVNTGDSNNIVYVPQGLPFRMVLNSSSFPKIHQKTTPNSDKPLYLQKPHPVLNQPDALDYTSVQRSPPASSSTTPPELNANKAAAKNHIANQIQSLRKVDLKGDSSWMNKNNHASPPADAPTPILAKEATPFQPSTIHMPLNPIITPQTIHHLHNSMMMPNFDIRSMTSFSKDLMDMPNRYPDMAVFTGNPRRAAGDNPSDGRVVTTTTTTTRTFGKDGAPEDETKEDRFFSNLKFVIGENGDIRPNITQLSH